MSIVAVDLAAKFSAAIWMDGTCDVKLQWDSWQSTEAAFIDQTTEFWQPHWETIPGVLVVEDLPQRVPWMSTVKDVCRLQGRFVERMASYHNQHRLLFLPPHQWRRSYEGLGRGTGPDAVVAVAARYGYTPPDLTSRIGKGEKAIARKVATDYCAAYLIGRFAVEYHAQHGTFDAPTTTRYTRT